MMLEMAPYMALSDKLPLERKHYFVRDPSKCTDDILILE